MKFYIKTFGCQQNKADSERLAAAFKNRGMSAATDYASANYIVINTCMVRRSAEDRVYGLVQNLAKIKAAKKGKNQFYKIIVTGCMVGLAFRDKTGQYLQLIRRLMPGADEFMPIEEIGFDSQPVRQDQKHALVPISNGCNNFCTFCVVPFTRGREISRPYNDIIAECLDLKSRDYTSLMLLGQNVNSYGADLLLGKENVQVMRDLDKTYFDKSSVKISEEFINNQSNKNSLPRNFHRKKPIYVKHLGRYRIPTLFPFLLEEVARLSFAKVEFMSSNPWDFSNDLIDVVARNSNISRTIHLPLQSGDNAVLKRMNRWYSAEEYLTIIAQLKNKIPGVTFTTDIIVGFCGETNDEFQNTVKVAKLAGFEKVYVSMYSSRPMTAATKVLADDVPHAVKKERWQILEDLINKPHLSFRKSFINRELIHSSSTT
ncbi:radical SAM protein [Candidatus Roizmanbacteria bacterium]|nr:radical SAM protein [Candidatus Roizmanbacteria bacterium]